MALDRIKGRIAFICDECQDGLETDEYELDEANEVAKEAGWKNVHKDNWRYNPPKIKAGVKYFNVCGHCYNNRT